MGTVEVIIAAAIVVAVVVGVGVALGRRRMTARPSASPVPPKRVPRPEPAPMTGLEDALAQVTDRSGTTMRDKIDAESGQVDELRVTDDTGPLLRRALDQVEPATETGAGTGTEDVELGDPPPKDVGDTTDTAVRGETPPDS